MSFLSLFKQPPEIKKPYRCCNCKARFTLKALAANHQRQTSIPRCRDMGFSEVSQQIPNPIPHNDVKEPLHEQDGMIAEEKMGVQDHPDDVKELKEPILEDKVFPFGDEIIEDEEKAKKDRMSRKGCMKATPSKISRCLRRMESLEISDENRSQRSIATQVASEFSTLPRNCYT